MVTRTRHLPTAGLPAGADFEALVARHRPQIERAALSLTGDADDAADLVQDTLIRAFRYFHNFAAGSNFRAWVLRILQNTHISRYRQARRSQDNLAWEEIVEHGEGRVEEAAVDRAADPDHAVLAMLPDEEVQVALESLPASFRQVIELSDLHDYTYAEIGDLLDLPIGTVRSRLFRARQRLRLILSDYAVRNGYLRADELDEVLLHAA
ncbi:MAG: sigma-70 family RNA polymerase sigma factor [Fimbriimonadaceae bacterium]|nr:sigma-70 family RNA polymerase sigma factor [Fimbriimonadaceae bacterium]